MGLDWRNQAVLLTGATGFLGFRTLERLAHEMESGRVIATGRTLRPSHEVVSSKVSYRLGNLTESAFVAGLFEEHPIRAIIHCAGLSSPWGKPEAFYQANVLSQQHLIKRAKRHGIKRFVFISSPSVCATHRDRHQVKESDRLPAPINEYARTKRLAEELLVKTDLSWITLRPRALVGRGDTVIMPRIVQAVESGRLRILGSGKNLVDLTPVSNVVDAIVLSLEVSEKSTQHIYHISNGKPVSMWEAIAYVLQALGYEAPKRKIPLSLAIGVARVMEGWAKLRGAELEPALLPYSVSSLGRSFSLDIRKAQTLLGYQPQQSIYAAMDEFVEWFKRDLRL
ncbi:MAG: NAD-dependent epimerase/dehydratase family protein [Bacteroidota bacterium]